MTDETWMAQVSQFGQPGAPSNTIEIIAAILLVGTGREILTRGINR
jgi:hypothetical protein